MQNDYERVAHMSNNIIRIFVTHIYHNYVASKVHIREEYEQGNINLFLGREAEVLVNDKVIFIDLTSK